MRRAILPFTCWLTLLASAALSAQTAPTAASVPIHLQPGDLIRVEIWREEDLSGEFLVDDNGMVTLPLLGPRRVAGVPLPKLRDDLIDAYRRQLNNPSISITPLRRVYVLGEVNAPGMRTVDPTISLAGVIALSGGANSQGDLRSIRVVRAGEVILDRVRAESALASLDVRSGDQIFVQRRSWFDRNSTFVVSALLSVTSIVISLAR